MADVARSISYSVVDSTQEVAIRLAKEGAPHGTAIIAESQLLGRGREGRTWVSPRGGLYCSMVLRPEAPVFPLLSLAVGLELQGALVPLVPAGRVSIRWPNDLLVGPADGSRSPRKVGGVLTDVVARPGTPAFAVVGVGLNVEGRRADFPPELQSAVAFLREFRDTPLPLPMLDETARSAVLRACERLSLPEGRRALPDALAPHLYGVGRTVELDGSTGTFLGVGAEGQALVRVGPDGPVRALVAGELHLEVA